MKYITVICGWKGEHYAHKNLQGSLLRIWLKAFPYHFRAWQHFFLFIYLFICIYIILKEQKYLLGSLQDFIVDHSLDCTKAARYIYIYIYVHTYKIIPQKVLCLLEGWLAEEVPLPSEMTSVIMEPWGVKGLLPKASRS